VSSTGAKPEHEQTSCKGHTYVDAFLALTKISKCEYVRANSHLRKCEYTVPLLNKY